MRHDWVLEVLDDLIAYARRNALPELAAGAESLRRSAEAELAACAPAGAPPALPAEEPGPPGPGEP